MPVIVICVPAIAVVGVTLVMLGVLTVRFTVFDHTPPCNTCETPVFEPDATLATICVSLQLTTTPYVLPSQTLPLPWLAPKPVPVMVICVPAIAVVGVTPVIFGVLTVRFTVLDHTPPCNTWATPLFEPVATFATICV